MQSTRPFISFSINREDALLNRLFGDRDSGFFVDVGAAHPVLENDTKVLSDRGWSGINIEPNATFFRALELERPRDRNLNVAVGDMPGVLTFHEVVDTGLSTLDADAARDAALQGFTVVDHEVEVRSLRQILADAAVPAIDLLKIDVEGFELKVLASNDWDRFRPSLIMTEATFPLTPVRRPDHITPYLAARGYRHVYFDGLNDYYAEAELSIPAGVFDVPLSVFDRVLPFGEVLAAQAREALGRDVVALTAQLKGADATIASLQDALRAGGVRADELNDRILAMSHDLDRGNREIGDLRGEVVDLRTEVGALLGAGAGHGSGAMIAQVQALREQIVQLRASSSWRITRPLRAIAHPKRSLAYLWKRFQV